MPEHFERFEDAAIQMKKLLLHHLAESRADFPHGMKLSDLTQVLYDVMPHEVDLEKRVLFTRALSSLVEEKLVEQIGDRFNLVVN